MNVDAILRGKGTGAITLQPDATVTEAAQILTENRIGAIVISGDGVSVDGIVSERDIVRAISKEGASALTRAVSEIMTSDVVTCGRGDQVDSLMSKMTEGRFRHLPVIVDGALFGIISIGDVVKARIMDVEHEAEQLRAFIAS